LQEFEKFSNELGLRYEEHDFLLPSLKLLIMKFLMLHNQDRNLESKDGLMGVQKYIYHKLFQN
jgi:hypothetical protein